MEQEKKRKGCLRRRCLWPVGVVLGIYLLWSLWTGWLGPDRIDTWGVSVHGAIASHLLAGCELLAADARGTEGYLELLRRPIPQSLERPAVGSEDPEVAAGLQLPPEYHPHLKREYEVHSEVLLGDFLVRNAFEDRYRWRYKTVSRRLWEARSTEAIEWLARRADVLPPRRADTLLYSYGGWGGGGQDPEFWQDTREAWRRMARGKNPYWRLGALGCARHWAQDREEEREVYLGALQERSDAFLGSTLYAIRYYRLTDPELLQAVLRVARTHPGGHDISWSEDIRRLAEKTAEGMRSWVAQSQATPVE